MKSIGFLGGTFNPVHNGHLLLAEEARRQFNLEQVLFIPNFNPPHRGNAGELIDAETRRWLAVLATLDNPRFLVSDIEIKRKGTSYTIDTLLELKQEHPENGYYFIGGDDCLTQHTWHQFSEIMKNLEGLLVATRTENGFLAAAAKVRESAPVFLSKIKRIEMPLVEISASEIRKRIRSGESISHLVPEPVEKYIRRYKIYGEVYQP